MNRAVSDSAFTRHRGGLIALAAIVVTVLLANAPYLLGLRSNDPLMYHAGLANPQPGLTGARWGGGSPAHTWMYTIDANDGWTVQALGRAAANEWIRGHVPLWNLYEGLGQPLAGEMQSAAFFLPFVLLHLLPGGVFVFHLVLELCAGVGTLLLLRKLGLRWSAATFGACLFAVNGTFSVMTNAPFNPIAFLPWGLWGIEVLMHDVRDANGRRRGAWIIAAAIALMLLAGFPETAYLEGLFMGVWVLARLPQVAGRRSFFLRRCAAGALAGVVLASPVVLAFVHFLTFAHVGYHGGDSSGWHYSIKGLGNLLNPYLLGGLGAKPVGNDHAGYVTMGTALLVPFAFARAGERRLKVTLAVLVGVLVANMFGCGPVNMVLNLVPGVRNLLLYKYGYVLVTFSVIVLASMGIDSVRDVSARRRWVLGVAAVFSLVLAASLGAAWRNSLIVHPTWTTVAATACVAIAAVVLIGVARGVGESSRGRAARGLTAVVVVAEAVMTFMVPAASASPPVPVDLAPIAYLKQHLGTGRFYTLGPIQPNYGSAYGLTQLNINDLPVASKNSEYIVSELKPAPGTPGSRGTGRAFVGSQLTPLNFPLDVQRELFAAYVAKQSAYRRAGVTHLVTAPGVVPTDQARRAGLTKVFTSERAQIWLDAGAAPYYSVAAGNCTVTRQTYADADVTCTTQATITRRQLSTPGWAARVDGAKVRVGESADGWFQDIIVPAGHHRIEYDYRPPFFAAAVTLSAVMFLLGCGDLVRERRRTRRPRLDLDDA